MLEFPIARKIAAPALYMAIIGIEARTIRRYVRLSFMTSGSIFPKTWYRITFCPRYPRIMMKIENRNVKLKSWAVASHPVFGSFLPRYCPAITAPPVARAVKILMMSSMTVSTKETPETAASPTRATMIESESPTAT